jgi:hypothetical protein
MTRLLSKRMTIFGICCSLTMFALESQSAPIRSGIVRTARMNPKQRATTRLQTNRALRQLMRAKPGAIAATSLSGLKGASGISTAAMSLGTDTAISSAVSTTTALPTLHEVWASLAPTMRFANQLEPDPNTGVLPNSALLADLMSRRTTNQAQFDTFHPQIAQLLDWDTVIRANSVPSGPRPANTNPQVVIPEPSSILIGLGLMGFAAWHRARSRTQA